MDDIQRVATWLSEAKSAVAFTGAGISTESGIPDFRSPGGVWSRTQPVYFEDFLASEPARQEYWRQKSETHTEFMHSQPNAGHAALAGWEAEGRIRAVITQNIDGLHQIAGSRHVVELHGTARYVACLDCGARFEADPMVKQFRENGLPPACPKCGGITKHATISFGQQLDTDILEQATELTQQADLFLAMGSSLVVHPAAGLPPLAKRNGARLVIINRDATEQDQLADVVIHASIGETLSAIAGAMRQVRFRSNGESDTRRFGQALANAVPGGTTVALIGTLGAGKTRLVQSVAEALGVPNDTVISPTFVLCQEYAGRLKLYHMDAYRLKDDDEFLQLGPDEYFESDGITMIEWADRVDACLPEDHLEIRIDPLDDSTREITISAIGEGFDAVLASLRKAVM